MYAPLLVSSPKQQCNNILFSCSRLYIHTLQLHLHLHSDWHEMWRLGPCPCSPIKRKMGSKAWENKGKATSLPEKKHISMAIYHHLLYNLYIYIYIHHCIHVCVCVLLLKQKHTTIRRHRPPGTHPVMSGALEDYFPVGGWVVIHSFSMLLSHKSHCVAKPINRGFPGFTTIHQP